MTPSRRSFVIPSCSPQTSVSFSLVVSTYNERDNIEKLIAKLSTLLDQALPEDYELIIVDDDSPDRTWALVEACLPLYPQLRVMRRRGERGLASAVLQGWQQAQGEVLGVMDGDFQHPPDVLLRLLAALTGSVDLAIASRHIEGGGVKNWSQVRQVLSQGARRLGRLLLPEVMSQVHDPMSGYFLIRRSAISARRLYPLGYKVLIEVLARGQIRQVVEVPYVFQERIAGASKVTLQQYWDYLHHLLRLRFALTKQRWLKPWRNLSYQQKDSAS